MNDRPGRTRVIVGGGAAIISPEGRLLVVQQEHPRGLDWGYVGGGLEPGELIEECVIREASQGYTSGSVACFASINSGKSGRCMASASSSWQRQTAWPQEVALPEQDGSTKFLAYRWIDRPEFEALDGNPDYDFARLPWPEDVVAPVFRRTEA